MTHEPQTWHYGLMARWWAEFTVATPDELAYYGGLIRRVGEPALDLACGTGRILLPLLAEGLDVDGADVSPDMLAQAARLAAERGLSPTLHAQAMHELDLPRRYRSIFICGSFALGATRAQDRQTLRRIFEHLEPGGVLAINHEFPYANETEASWGRWLAGRWSKDPGEWDEVGDRRRMADGDELELFARFAAFDPLAQTATLEMRIRLWHGHEQVAEERRLVDINAYFAQELLLMLEEAGFRDVTVEGNYTGVPATPDDGTVVFVAHRPR